MLDEIELKDSSPDWNESMNEVSDVEEGGKEEKSEKVNLLLEHFYTVYYDQTL